MKESQVNFLVGLTTVLGIVLLAAAVVFTVNQLTEASRVSTQAVAIDECMKYGIPDGFYHEGEIYCLELRGWVDFQRTMHFFRKATPIEEIRKVLE